MPATTTQPPPVEAASRPSPTLDSDLAAARLTAAAWLDRWRAGAVTYVGVGPDALIDLRQRCPRETAALLRSADRALRHEFDLLGSGPFVPIDPDRPPRGSYRPIDWYRDPVRGLRFPAGVPHKQWNLYAMRPGNADVKYPWELARSQHWVTLAQAYCLTADERYAREIADELDDFVEANPIGIGVNWTCTMDVGLRAVSWVVALDLVRCCPALDGSFRIRAAQALFDHGVFIRNNLENTYEVTSNHFLSNVVGLWFLGALFADLPEGSNWMSFARQALETEIDVQVLPDGADFESSVPYHRLVAELFLGCARLADHRGQPLSDRYRARVRDMVEYLACVLRPDGLMPQSGDADDGRLHVLSGAGEGTPQDARHLLGPAAGVFDRPEWQVLGGSSAAWESAWWGLPSAPAPAETRVERVARLFPDAGHAVVRERGTYLLVTNSIVGTKGFGNHKHNDQLSFEYHVAGRAIVVDPGSYVYTSDLAARNLFRGTAYHNTLMIDGVEQNEINPEWLFRTFEKANAKHLEFRDRDAVVEYRGRHEGYSRLSEGVTHERRFRLDTRAGRLDVDDLVAGGGRHFLAWHFHFAPGVTVKRDRAGVVLTAGPVTVALSIPAGLAADVGPGWYSPSYGCRVACECLTLSADVDVTAPLEWRFTFMTKDNP